MRPFLHLGRSPITTRPLLLFSESFPPLFCSFGFSFSVPSLCSISLPSLSLPFSSSPKFAPPGFPFFCFCSLPVFPYSFLFFRPPSPSPKFPRFVPLFPTKNSPLFLSFSLPKNPPPLFGSVLSLVFIGSRGRGSPYPVQAQGMVAGVWVF